MLLDELFEVSLGNYLNKASMSRGQAQMGAMFGKDPKQRAQDLATFNKRDRGITRAKGRVEKQRQADLQKQMADTIARLPELKAEYEKMKARYKALGGSNWQYADREQNLTDTEREARAMEGPMNNLWRQIQAAEKAKTQGVAEGNFNKTPSGDYVNMHTGVRSSSAPTQKKVRGYKWHVNFDYGPHMTDTVVVSAASESEAIAKAEKAAEKKGLSIMVNWAKPHYRVEQGVAEGFDNIRSMIQQYEDMVELVYDLPPGRKKNIAIDKRDALEAQIEAMPGGSEALRKWARAYNDSFDEGVAEGPGFDKWADERAASQIHKLKNPYHPKTWHDVDSKLGKAVDKMSQAEKVKKGLAHPNTLKK